MIQYFFQLNTIKKRLQQYLDEDKLYGVANKVKNRQEYKKNMISNQIEVLNNKMIMYDRKIEQLYEDRLNGILQVEDFERMYSATIEDKKDLNQRIEKLKLQKSDVDDELKLKELVKQFMSMKEITREMLVLLIDKITVTEQKEITIYYKFNVLNESSQNENEIAQIKCS